MTTGKHLTLVGEQLGEGADHRVFGHRKRPDLVVKVPKKARPVAAVSADLNACQKHFAEFLPWTALHIERDGKYCIHQEKIEGVQHLTLELLKTNEDIRRQFHALLSTDQQAVKMHGIAYDYFGLEGGAKSLLTLFDGHRGALLDKMVVTPGLQMGLWLKGAGMFPLMPAKAIEWWRDKALAPQMANVVVGRDAEGKLRLYTPDIAVLHIADRQAWLHDQWNRLLMRQFFGEVLK